MFDLQYHLVLVSKYRHKIFDVVDIIKILRITETKVSAQFVEIGTDRDHVHLCIRCKPNYSLSSLIRRIKQISTFEAWSIYEDYLSGIYYRNHKMWSGSYFISTIGNVSKTTVLEYIRLQGQFTNRAKDSTVPLFYTEE